MSIPPWAHRARRFVSHPATQLVIGLLLVGSSLAEVLAPWLEGDSDIDLGSEHGVLVFGLLHVLKSLAEFFEGLEKAGEAVAERSDEKKHIHAR